MNIIGTNYFPKPNSGHPVGECGEVNPVPRNVEQVEDDPGHNHALQHKSDPYLQKSREPGKAPIGG